MVNEVTIRSSLQISSGVNQVQTQPTAFIADIVSFKGPTPGVITATTEGVDVDLSELTTPGFCRLMNQDATNFASIGIWDGVSFYPMLELLPGQPFVVRLSRNLGEEYGSGTGTSGAAINTLRVKADTASVNVLVEVYEA